MRGADDPARDFAAVGDKDRGKTRAHHFASRPVRRALLDEGGDALAALGPAQARSEASRGVLEIGGRSRRRGRRDQPLGRGVGARRAAADLLAQSRERRVARLVGVAINSRRGRSPPPRGRRSAPRSARAAACAARRAARRDRARSARGECRGSSRRARSARDASRSRCRRSTRAPCRRRPPRRRPARSSRRDAR